MGMEMEEKVLYVPSDDVAKSLFAKTPMGYRIGLNKDGNPLDQL